MKKLLSIKTIILSKIQSMDLDNILSWGLVIYFFLILSPYCFAPIKPIYNFFTSSFVSIFIRAISSLFLVAIMLVVQLKKNPRINYRYISIAAILFLCLLLSIFFTNPNFSSILTHDPYAYMTYVNYRVGIFELLSGFLSCLVDLFFGYAFLFILPSSVTKKTIKKLLYSIFIFISIEILYSLVFEFSKYYRTIFGNNSSYGGYDIDIRASFISKNQFGAFLVMGFISCFLIYKWYSNKKYYRILLIIVLVLIMLISILSLCKTAITSLFLFWLCYFICFMIFKVRNKQFTIVILASSIVFFIIIFAIVINFTGLKNVLGFKQINNLISGTLSRAFSIAFEERANTWLNSLQILDNYHILFGYPKATVFYALDVGTNGANYYSHNGFIQQLIYYGIPGLVILFFAYYWIIRRIMNRDSFSERTLFFSIFLAGLSFMMTETEIMIVSSSMLVFLFNIIFSLLNDDYHGKAHFYETTI